MPFAEWIGYVHPVMQIPLNAVYLTAGISSLIALLVLGPATILNGVFGAASVCFFFSYDLPIWLLQLCGRGKLPKKRYFDLGKLGTPLNILAVCWQILSVIFLSFPQYNPVTLENMNWASASAAVGLGVFAVNWFAYSNKYFRQPKPLYISGLQEREISA